MSLTVRDQTGGEVQFKVKTTTKLLKIMNAYCDKKAVSQDHLKFLYDGSRLRGEDTPEGLDMEDGDCIDAVIEQVGGN